MPVSAVLSLFLSEIESNYVAAVKITFARQSVSEDQNEALFDVLNLNSIKSIG